MLCTIYVAQLFSPTLFFATRLFPLLSRDSRYKLVYLCTTYNILDLRNY